MHAPDLHARAARDLEWEELLDTIAGGCASEVGAARIRALTPASTRAEAEDRMRLTAEALEALDQAEPVPAANAPDLAELLEHVGRGGALPGEDMARVARLLLAAKALRAYATAQRPRLPLLAAALSSEPSLDKLAAQITRSVDETGYVLDAASRLLADARRRVTSLRGDLMDRMRQLAKRFEDVLREGGPIERDGRYALPVRSDSHRKVDGIVLGASATGATLYVEPPEITEMQNRLTLALGEVEREIARVLRELSDAVRQQIVHVVAAYECCVSADVLAALSRWAEASRGRAILVDGEARLELRMVRHPLLVARGVEVVPNDLAIAAGRALVVSGPNAGGKTVVLKCLGLCAWMAAAGIPVPTGEGSLIGFYDEVITDIGDAQSLERSLSTFSAEVVALAHMLERAGERTLVLLDEIAGGTDPEEGAALAAAVLERLVAAKASVAVTTHYERLKELAAESPGFENASVGFDFDAMQPTFTFTMGVPGASSALHVAQRFGIPSPVIARARELLSAEALRREELIADLERQRAGLHLARAGAESDLETARRLREEAEEERKTVRQKERDRLAREASELTAKVREARAMLRAAEQDIEAGGKLKGAERAIDGAAKLVSLDGDLARAARGREQAAPAAEATLVPGATVFVERLGTTAEVVEPPERGHVRVQRGSFTLRVPVEEVRLGPKGKKPPPAPKPLAKPTPAVAAALRTSDNTCDLRGQRVEEALTLLDGFIDACLRRAEAVGFVLHGHGTGALRRGVREHLALHGHVANARPANTDEGGDAFTIFWIRD